MTAISYHDTVNDLQGLSIGRSGPFDSLAWFSLLEATGRVPLIGLARSGEHAVAVPLIPTYDGLASFTNWYAFTWEELASEGAEREALLTDLARSLASRTQRVVLDKVADEDGAAARLSRAFRAAGWWVDCSQCDSNHVLEVAGRSFATYLEGRPGPVRTTLKRKAKKVSVEIFRHFVAEAWSAYEEVYEDSWKPCEEDRALLRQWAEAEGALGHLRLGIARHRQQVVAAQFWTVEDGVAYIHKLAHRESAATLSAGTTLTAALFAEAIDRDQVRRVDFGTGNDAYKRDWMDHVRPRYRLTCLRPARPANWATIVKLAMRQLVSRSQHR